MMTLISNIILSVSFIVCIVIIILTFADGAILPEKIIEARITFGVCFSLVGIITSIKSINE